MADNVIGNAIKHDENHLNNETEIDMNEDEIKNKLDVESENQVEVELEDKFLDVHKPEHKYSTDSTINTYTHLTTETMVEPPTGGYPAELYNEKKYILKQIGFQPFLPLVFFILTIVFVLMDKLTFATVSIFIFLITLFIIDIIEIKGKGKTNKIKIYEKLDSSKLLLDTLNKKIKLAPKYNIEIHEHLEFAIKMENEIEKLYSNISSIFTENELITNGKDVRKCCDTVDGYNKKISDVLSKLNNELADKILKQ